MYKRQSLIFCHDTLCAKVCVGDITFETVPFAVLRNLLLANGDFNVLANFKKIVIAPLVDLLLCDAPALISHSQACNTMVTIVGIFLCTFLRVTDDKTFTSIPFALITMAVFLCQ